MNTTLTDAELESRVENLCLSITTWLKRHKMWHDCGFKSFSDYFGEFARPRQSPVVLVFWFEGPFYEAFHGYSGGWNIRNAFDKFVEDTGLWYQCEDHLTLTFMPNDDELCAAYNAYYDFQWLCHAILPSYVDLNSEIYTHFYSHPDDLLKLSHRDFEILLDAIFRNHGYRTALGPGSNDGGVDIRLYQDDNIGELITLVQAKRFAKHRPIGLEAVAALKAVVDDEQAHRGLFVTTSRFLPSAKKFAKRQSRRLVLADPSDVQKWCSLAATQIDEPNQIDLTSLPRKSNNQSLVGTIFHGHSHSGANRFVIVVKEASGTVFVRQIKQSRVPPPKPLEPGIIWNGPDIPNIHQGVVTTDKGYYIARLSENRRSFWADQTSFSVWNGEPVMNNIDWWD